MPGSEGITHDLDHAYLGDPERTIRPSKNSPWKWANSARRWGLASVMQTCCPVATQTHRGLWNPVIACLKALVNYRVSAPICPAGMTPDTERFLLEHGQEWSWKRERLPFGVRSGPVRHCYLNAASAALSQPKLIYVEGWACTHLYQPVGHAWCIHRETLTVIDPTWESNHRDRIYFGIAFKTAFLRQFKERSSVELSILGWSEADWPVQTGRIPREVWAFDADR